jgi:hypothetical protein
MLEGGPGLVVSHRLHMIRRNLSTWRSEETVVTFLHKTAKQTVIVISLLASRKMMGWETRQKTDFAARFFPPLQLLNSFVVPIGLHQSLHPQLVFSLCHVWQDRPRYRYRHCLFESTDQAVVIFALHVVHISDTRALLT